MTASYAHLACGTTSSMVYVKTVISDIFSENHMHSNVAKLATDFLIACIANAACTDQLPQL